MKTEQGADSASLTEQLLYALRYYLASRRGLIALGLLAVGIGVALNWSWFVAAGLAPVILALAPCAAMCALGLCMHKLSGKPRATDVNMSKVAAGLPTDEAQRPSSTSSKAVETSSNGTNAIAPAEPSDVSERRMSTTIQPYSRGKEK
jgi:hypothetical protein